MKQNLGNVKRRALQVVVVFAVFALVSMGMPTVLADEPDGRIDDNRYRPYWNEYDDTTTLQINPDELTWSVPNCDVEVNDDLVNGYVPGKGEIRYPSEGLYAEPTYGDRGQCGKASLMTRIGTPEYDSGHIEMPIEIQVTVQVPEGSDYPHSLTGIELLYFSPDWATVSKNNDRQYDIGGNNVEASDHNNELAELFKSAYMYQVGKWGMPWGEIDIARQAIDTFSDSEKPPFKSPENNIAMRKQVAYENKVDDEVYDGKFMTFFESVLVTFPSDVGDQRELDIYLDGVPSGTYSTAWSNDGYPDPDIGDDEVAKWTINFKQLNDITDGESDSGGGGGGGTPPGGVYPVSDHGAIGDVSENDLTSEG